MHELDPELAQLVRKSAGSADAFEGLAEVPVTNFAVMGLAGLELEPAVAVPGGGMAQRLRQTPSALWATPGQVMLST
jgi:hypothetical protein